MADNRDGPSIFLNSVPKSGTNLVNQLILGMPNVTLSGAFIYEGLARDLRGHRAILSDPRPNLLHLGHVYHSGEWAQMLRDLPVRTVFVSRDPRDVLVSLAYFIVEKLPDYVIYRELAALKTQRERYLLLIRGIGDYPNIRDWFRLFAGWRSEPHVLTVTYEALMRSPASRMDTLLAIAGHVWAERSPSMPLVEIAARMEANRNPSASFTFRKGQIGGWRQEFDDEVKAAFKEVAGPLLIELGYERDMEW